MLRSIGEAAAKEPHAVCKYLKSLTPALRFDLLRVVVPALRIELSALIAGNYSMAVRRAPRDVAIPEHLPPALLLPLQAYRDRLTRRYDRLVASGHTRAYTYVSRIMLDQIRLAEHLATKGIERWDVVRKRDIVTFLQEHPHVRKNKVMTFLHFVNDHQPFKETRGRPTRSQGGERRNIRPPAIVPPAVLDDLLDDIRKARSDAEYLLAWLVCRMGMMANSAYLLPLDRVRINAAGQLVLRPAQVWVATPKAIDRLFKQVVEAAVPLWTQKTPEQLEQLTFFPQLIPHLTVFTGDVLQGRTRVLRASAIFAAMMNGHVDRVTLHQTMGASMPFIVKLELLLAADMHRRLDPALVVQRNAHILGKANG